MAVPLPPASPVAPMITEWPATREEEAKRLKETMVALEKYMLIFVDYCLNRSERKLGSKVKRY
jgi:hypothetical protein